MLNGVNVNANRPQTELTLFRGLFAGVVAGTCAFAVPWMLLYLISFANWLRADFDPSREGAWIGSYFMTAIFGPAAFVTFATRPRSWLGSNAGVITLATVVALSVQGMVEGRRYKSDPQFGEKPLDIVLLTVPALATAIVLLIWRILSASRTRSAVVAPTEAHQLSEG
jgi:hypothetical protein